MARSCFTPCLGLYGFVCRPHRESLRGGVGVWQDNGVAAVNLGDEVFQYDELFDPASLFCQSIGSFRSSEQRHGTTTHIPSDKTLSAELSRSPALVLRPMLARFGHLAGVVVLQRFTRAACRAATAGNCSQQRAGFHRDHLGCRKVFSASGNRFLECDLEGPGHRQVVRASSLIG